MHPSQPYHELPHGMTQKHRLAGRRTARWGDADCMNLATSVCIHRQLPPTLLTILHNEINEFNTERILGAFINRWRIIRYHASMQAPSSSECRTGFPTLAGITRLPQA